MVEVYKNNPVVKFFSEVFLMVLAAGILVLIVGWFKHWSRPVDYSNGFFLACIALAAISSSLAIMRRPGMKKKLDQDAQDSQVPPPEPPAFTNKTEKFFATRSVYFKLLMASLICLILSILIEQ